MKIKKSYYLKSPCKATRKAFRTGDWTESEAIDKKNEEVLRTMYEKLVNGEIKIFWNKYRSQGRKDCPDVWESATVWHRSTRPGVLIQESHMWFKNGELIPCSHHNINSFEDLMKEHGYTYGVWYKTA